MGSGADQPGGTRRRNSVAPNPWRRGRRRPSTLNAEGVPQAHGVGTPQTMIAGLFTDAKHAERAYQALFARGYRPDEVIVVIPEATWRSLFGTAAADPDDPGRQPPTEPSTRYQTAAGEFPVPVPVAVSSNLHAKRVMAAGRIAALLRAANRSTGGDGLTSALAACGIPHRLTQDCAAAIDAGKILLGVIPRSADDVVALGVEWTRRNGEVLDR